MRSSNVGHHYAKEETKKFKKGYSRTGSVIVALVIAFSAIVIPGTTVVQNVEAVTNVKNAVFSIGDNEAFSDIIVKTCKNEEKKNNKQEKAEKKSSAKTKKNKPAKATATEPETTQETTTAQTTATTTETVSETQAVIAVSKSQSLVSTIKTDPNYTTQHVELSSDQRDKLERLVMGEAGSLGYTGCALVAQAVRDSMVLSGTTSVDEIINTYQYSASLDNKPNSSAKSAVSYIFDSDGYAVQHRILYFYASDVVSNAWHESQNFIISYGNVRFFDKW